MWAHSYMCNQHRTRAIDCSIVTFGTACINLNILCSRYQLAFALLVAELLPGLTGPLEAYDPVFNGADRAFLKDVGVKVWPVLEYLYLSALDRRLQIVTTSQLRLT